MIRQALDFWKGDAGVDYIDRNTLHDDQFKSRCFMWQRILANCFPNYPRSVLEVGANVGRNIRAINRVSSQTELWAVEPNSIARSSLELQPFIDSDRVFDGAIQDLPMRDNSVDLAFTCGVLIHIPPSDLLMACREVVRVARDYVVAIEYFSAKSETIEYRGEQDKLWKRDFGQFYIDHFNLKPVYVGFEWKAMTGLDNLTWWIFKK